MSDSPLPILFVRNPCEGSDFYLRFLFLFQNKNQEKEKKFRSQTSDQSNRRGRNVQPNLTQQARREQANKKRASTDLKHRRKKQVTAGSVRRRKQKHTQQGAFAGAVNATRVSRSSSNQKMGTRPNTQCTLRARIEAREK